MQNKYQFASIVDFETLLYVLEQFTEAVMSYSRLGMRRAELT